MSEPNDKQVEQPMLPNRLWIASYVASEYAGVLSRGLHFRSIHDSKEESLHMNRDPQAIGFAVAEYAKVEQPKAGELPPWEIDEDFIQVIRDTIELGKDDGDIATLHIDRLQTLLNGFLAGQQVSAGLRVENESLKDEVARLQSEAGQWEDRYLSATKGRRDFRSAMKLARKHQATAEASLAEALTRIKDLELKLNLKEGTD